MGFRSFHRATTLPWREKVPEERGRVRGLDANDERSHTLALFQKPFLS